MKNNKKAAILSLLLSATLLTSTGCSKKNEKVDEVPENGITVEDFYGNEKKYSYFLNNNYYYTLGSVIDELHMTTKIDLKDNYKSYSRCEFYNNLGMITIPDSYNKYTLAGLKKSKSIDVYDDIYTIKDLSSVKYYYIISKLVANDKINRFNEHYFGLVLNNCDFIKSGDFIETKTLIMYNYRTQEYETLAHFQTGIGADDENVLNANIGCIDEMISNVEDGELSYLSGKSIESSEIQDTLRDLYNSNTLVKTKH